MVSRRRLPPDHGRVHRDSVQRSPDAETFFLANDMKRTRVLSTKGPVRKQSIGTAARLLRQGKLVAFPTETVYGLGANAYDTKAVRQIFHVKGRPGDNPLIVHIWSLQQVGLLADAVPLMFWVLAKRFLPGPLTMVVRKSALVPPEVTSGLPTIALRLPGNPVARALLREVNLPIVAPSANLSGGPSPTTVHHVLDDLDGKIAAVLDGGTSAIGVESTVLDITRRVPTILRPGGITQEEIEDAIHLHVRRARSTGVRPASPGMKYRHYAPRAEVVVFEGSPLRVLHAMVTMVRQKTGRDIAVGVMAEASARNRFPGAEFFSLGDEGVAGAARRLYEGFRRLDKKGVSLILCRGFADEKLGRAFMNRLRKAAARRIRI
jgi:L-threonylcarbamoyladenylate synthase